MAVDLLIRGETVHSWQRDRADRLTQSRSLYDDVREATVAADTEERLQGRLHEIQIDETDTPTRSGLRHRQVCDRRGFSFAPQRRRHHDHPRLALEVDELETRPHPPERLGVD